MSTAIVDAADVGLALLDEQQGYLQAQGGTWMAQAHVMQVQLQGELDVARLQHVLAQLPQRHTALAAQLAGVPGYRGLRQFFAAAQPGAAVEVEPHAESADAVQARQQQWLQRPGSVLTGKCLQALLQRLGEQQWQLTLGVAAHAADQASLAILYRDLIAAYQAGECQPDEELGQFAQYLEWRAEVSLDEDAASGRQYWQAHLGNSECLAPQLPERRAAADGQQAMARRVRARVGALGEGADDMLQAAWWAVLAKISGREAFTVGWRHDARRDYEFFADTVGLLEKTLPLHLQLPAGLTFAQALTQLRATLEQHVTWQEYGGADVYGGVVTTSHAFGQRPVLPAQTCTGLQWHAEYLTAMVPQAELTLVIERDADGLAASVVLEYDARHHDDAAMAALLDQYQVLLGQLQDGSASTLGQTSLVGPAEQARLLALNPPTQVLDASQLLPARIDHWAKTTPDAVALVAGSQVLSYAQLQAEAARRAAWFAGQGVTAGAVVALALPRGVALLASLLATWRLGAAYLPLDPNWPVERQLQLALQANAVLLVADGARAAELSGQGLTVVDADALPQTVLAEPAALHLQADSLAYVLFTSGSTGTPKAVQVEHRQLCNYVAGACAELGLAACRQFAFTGTVAADLGNTTLFGALYLGATLQVADDATLQDPQRFAAYIGEQGIDCLKIVPSHLAALLEGPAPQLPATLVLGGEAVAPNLLQRIRALRADCRVFNHYGPSEATVGVLVRAIDASDLAHGSSGLDRVLANNQVYVLDALQRLAATGELGELYIGGAQLARGYLGADELTAAAFVQLPWLANERVYRTGDLARYRAEGGVVLYGRRDHQVKVRGYRVELAEVEQQLLSAADVSEAVVLHVDGELQAFVLAHQGAPANWLEQLKAFVQHRLPSAMVPQRYQVVARMPRLANGKVDRQALLAMEAVADVVPMVEPRDALERVLMSSMARLLGQEQLSVEQDFFAAGGHSLLVIKLVAGIRKLLHCEVHPGIVFDNPSPAQLATALRAQESAPGQLEKLAQARLRLDAMSPEEKAALMARAK